jgi:hypothetical protein
MARAVSMPRAILVLEFMVVLLRFSLAHLGQQICDEHHPRKTAGAQLILLAITIALQSKLRCHHRNRRRVPELSNEQVRYAPSACASVLTMAKTFLLSLTEGCRQFGRCKFIAARTPFLESGRKRALLGARCFSFNRDFLPIGSIEKVIAP